MQRIDFPDKPIFYRSTGNLVSEGVNPTGGPKTNLHRNEKILFLIRIGSEINVSVTHKNYNYAESYCHKTQPFEKFI